MGERTSHAPGTFSWVDLATTDAGAAKSFYGGLLGWDFEDMPVPDSPPYTMARIGGRTVAALYSKRDDQAPPAWLSYVTVEDAGAIAGRAAELGATVIAEAFDVLDAGRMAVLQDPAGAVFAVWQPRASIGAELVNEDGALCLNQLNTSDPEAAQAFYAALFGWTFRGVPGGEAYWGIDNGERLNGGMMPLPAQAGAPSHWLTYFTSGDVDASAGKIGELGGRVLVGPMPVPSGRIAVAADPQGATFGLVEGRMDD
jgi:uncharacterized protein